MMSMATVQAYNEFGGRGTGVIIIIIMPLSHYHISKFIRILLVLVSSSFISGGVL